VIELAILAGIVIVFTVGACGLDWMLTRFWRL
jgi:hypothetical protein